MRPADFCVFARVAATGVHGGVAKRARVDGWPTGPARQDDNNGGLPRGPGEDTAAEEMEVNVKYCLTRALHTVQHETVSIGG